MTDQKSYRCSPTWSMAPQVLTLLRDIVYRHSGIHIADKEPGLLEARAAGRARTLGLDSLEDYGRLLQGAHGAQEIPSLIDAVTINYTFFFREDKHFQTLCAEVLPALAGRIVAGGRSRIRAWSAGCSSSEEPYSIAVSFAQVVGDGNASDFKVLGTDINRKVLRTARTGIYPLERLTLFPREHFYRFLTRDGETPEGCLRLSREIRQMVVFRRFNILLVTQSCEGQFDLIFCRNVMIYFDQSTKAALVRRFQRYLAPGGYLFIGESEVLDDPDRLFRQVGPSVFQRP